MSDKEVILTQDGLKKLEDELENLKSVKRREVAERIKVAIGYGDISENSEYEDAKNEQAFIEGRIITLEKMLRNARIINNDEINTDIVGVGATVTVQDLEFGDTMEYTIVGSAESDPLNNKISNESPVGKAIIGKQKGTVVDVNVPAGVIQYKIIDIKSNIHALGLKESFLEEAFSRLWNVTLELTSRQRKGPTWWGYFRI